MKLTIDSIVCDCIEGTSVALDFDAAALGDVESGREGLTLKMTLPATPVNDALFLSADDAHPAQLFNSTWHEAVVTADDATLFVGTAYLLESETADGVGRYRIALRGGATQWAKLTAARMFNTIDIDYADVLTPSTIARSWEDDSPVKFFPVHRDQYPIETASVGLLPPEKILSTMDYHPFISVERVIRAIFEQAGYTVESRFFSSEYFRSIYMSGAFSSTDTESQRRRMDFLAKRTADTTATANPYGRVYITPYMLANSVGNFVNTASPMNDTECYNNGGCFLIENNVATFRPPVAVAVSFEYRVKYITDYVIDSRKRLRGFDSIYFDSGIKCQYQIANRFVDRRPMLRPNFSYRAVMFGYGEGDIYQIFVELENSKQLIASFSSRSAIAVTPNATVVKRAELYCKKSGTKEFVLCQEDWAMYDGYITERGQTEVEISVRTPAENITPTSPKRFGTMYIEGAEEGMSFTLSHNSRLRPLFSASPGYGSIVRFADVAQHQIRQNVLIDALRQMFNLRIVTDERARKVRIEPADMLYDPTRMFDWSDKVVAGEPVTFVDAAREAHERITLCYAEGDAAVTRFNAETATPLGEWSFDVGSYVAIEGEQRLSNPLFAPTVNCGNLYANAPLAQIMQVGDRDALTGDDVNFSPRIVIYYGMAELPPDQNWGFPYNDREYPLAAFCFEADDYSAPFSLCFGDTVGVKGLHTYYDSDMERLSRRRRVTLSLRLSPSDFEALFTLGGEFADICSHFLFTLEGEKILCTLERIEGYDPAKESTRCTFLITNHDL